jgi:hypothetical protein
MKVVLGQNIFAQFFTGNLPSGDIVLQINLMLKTQKIIQGVSGDIVNILGGGSMDYSE